MKVIILAGGLEADFLKKLGQSQNRWSRPANFILWHIMKIFSAYGHNDFWFASYKGYVIKEYFRNYMLHQSDVSFDFKMTCLRPPGAEPLKVELVDTGKPMTGGRLGRLRERLSEEEDFSSRTETVLQT